MTPRLPTTKGMFVASPEWSTIGLCFLSHSVAFRQVFPPILRVFFFFFFFFFFCAVFASSGCTAVSLTIDRAAMRLYCANAGDSRAIICREGESDFEPVCLDRI